MILDLEQDELSGEIAISKDHKENLFLRSLHSLLVNGSDAAQNLK